MLVISQLPGQQTLPTNNKLVAWPCFVSALAFASAFASAFAFAARLSRSMRRAKEAALRREQLQVEPLAALDTDVDTTRPRR